MPKNHVSRNKADLSEIINILNHRKNKIQIRVIEANTEVLKLKYWFRVQSHKVVLVVREFS